MKNALCSKEWWSASAVRAIKTICQTLVSVVGVSATFTEVDWITALSTSLLAGFLSLCTSLAGIPEVKQLQEVEDIVEETEENEEE